MAEKTQVVGTNDKGQFVVNIPRGDIARVDVVDIDFVIQTKSGARLIIPGAAMDSMTASPPAIQFADGPLSSGALLATVQKVDTPPTSIPVMSSLTQYELKKSEGNKNVSRDGPEGRDADAATQEAMSQQVAPLPTEGGGSSVDKLLAKAEQLADDITKNAFDWAPNKPLELPGANPDGPPGQPPTAKIPLLINLSIGNVISDGTGIIGQGGPAGSGIANGILNNDAQQYGTETLTGGAGDDTIYADALTDVTGVDNTAAYSHIDKETGLATDGTAFYFVKEVAFNVAGYLRRVTSITISGLPDGVSIEGATSLGNGSFSLPSSLVIPTATVLNFIYDVTAIRALFPTGSDHVDINLTFNIKGYGVGVIDATKIFVLRFQDVDSTTDITANNPIYITGVGGGYSDIYVMPTASTPHLINAGEGNNVVYAGNSNDTINAGSGNDVIYAYAGNDIIKVGGGDNTVWAGNGNDDVTTGTGADVIQGGSGNNVIRAGDGANQVTTGDGDDTVTTGINNDTLILGDGKNIVTDTGGANTVTTTGSGDDTVTTGGGKDVIDVANGANIVFAGAGDNSITGGSGKDTLVGGGGADSIRAGDGDDTLYGGDGSNVMLDGGTGNDWLSFNGIGTTKVVDGVTVANNTAVLNDWLTYGGSDISGVSLLLNDASGNGTATHGGNTDTVTGIENFIGSGGNDTLDVHLYTGLAHTLYGLGGNDSLLGADGADFLYGGAGDDWISGNAGNDTIDVGVTDDVAPAASIVYGIYTVNNWVDGGAGADTVTGGIGINYFISRTGEYSDAAGNVDTFSGGDGTDILDFSTFTSALTITSTDAKIGSTLVARYSGIDEIITGSGSDTISGTAADEIFRAGNGTNNVTAGGGNDSIYGGTGTDYFNSTSGAGNTAYLNGGAGYNEYRLSSSVDTIDGQTASSQDRLFYNGSGVGVAISSVNYGVFVNLDTNDYGVSDAGLVGGAVSSSWWTGTTWIAMGVGNSGYQWLADNDGRGFYGYAQNDRYYGVEEVYGTNYADVIIGNSSNNYFFGYGGNDAMFGLSGNDTFGFVYNGTYNAGNEYIDGGSNDALTVTLGSGSLTISGGDGVDYTGASAFQIINLDSIVHESAVANQILSKSNSTTIIGTTSVYNVENAYGGNGDDKIYGSSGDNVLDGRSGADTIYGYAGNDFILGGYGANTNIASGKDTLDGGDGTDWISYSSISGAGDTSLGIELYLADADLNADGILDRIVAGTWDVGTGYSRYMPNSTAEIDILYNFENIQGSNYNDLLAGDSDVNVIWGMNGNDVIDGGAGGDTMDGGVGTDTLWYHSSTAAVTVNLQTNTASGGWAQGDVIANFENLQGSIHDDVLTGTSGANTIDGGAGGDIMDGGAGTDTLWYLSSTAAVTVNLQTNTASGGWAQGDVIANFENLRGSAHDDVLTGTSGVNTIWGGVGNDTIDGGLGNDTLYGDAGTDTVSYLAYSTSAVVANLTTGSATGGGGTDVLSGFENIRGSTYADTLTGDGNANTLWGSGGADKLSGAAGNDALVINKTDVSTATVNGGAGVDTLYAADWVLDNFNTARCISIEVVNLKGSTDIVTQALTNTTISEILDGSTDVPTTNTLTLYLDNGDTFTTTNANVTTSAVTDASGNVGTHYTYTGATTYYVDVYKTA